jgi:hypothetical protein
MYCPRSCSKHAWADTEVTINVSIEGNDSRETFLLLDYGFSSSDSSFVPVSEVVKLIRKSSDLERK